MGIVLNGDCGGSEGSAHPFERITQQLTFRQGYTVTELFADEIDLERF